MSSADVTEGLSHHAALATSRDATDADQHTLACLDDAVEGFGECSELSAAAIETVGMTRREGMSPRPRGKAGRDSLSRGRSESAGGKRGGRGRGRNGLQESVDG